MLSVFRLGQRVATTQITRFRVPVALMSHSFVATAGSSGLQRGNGTVEEQIRSKLMAAFEPELLVIANDSWKHSSHAAMRELGGGNGETHFAVDIVSKAFEGKPTLQRHRLVYATLDHELKSGVHALQLKTKTPSEMIARGEASSITALDPITAGGGVDHH